MFACESTTQRGTQHKLECACRMFSDKSLDQESIKKPRLDAGRGLGAAAASSTQEPGLRITAANLQAHALHDFADFSLTDMEDDLRF